MSCESNACGTLSNLRLAAAPMGNALSNSLAQWYQLSENILSRYFQLSGKVLDGYVNGIQKSMSLLPALQPSCKIPTTECPPYCVCELVWDAVEGDTLTGSIALHNTGEEPVQFRLKAKPFTDGCEKTPIMAEFDLAVVQLAPTESKTVTVTVSLVDQAVRFNRPHRAKVIVEGRYEQCVKLEFTVKPRSIPCCIIEHGEIPKRIVPHQWYHHFQCEEFCFKPIAKRKDSSVKLSRGKKNG